MTGERHAAPELIAFAAALMQRLGLPDERARVVAEILVEGDLFQHKTHGLNLLPGYLRDLEADQMTKTGDPITIVDHGSSVTWDGQYLPGPWLVTQAMELAFERIQSQPVVTVAIQRSHHISALVAYLKRATDRGLVMLLACSDPRAATVAPYGGLKPLYTPNPLAAGIPTNSDPILLDFSTSTTANGQVALHHQRGDVLPGPWLLDSAGNASDNPADMYDDGSVLPLGGLDLGYKGFGLGILVEALTAALSGHGRSDAPTRWGASVFLQIINPARFGGRDYFTGEMSLFAANAHANPTRPGDPPVRLPGERGLKLRAEQLESGVALYPTILPNLQPWADKLNVAMPAPYAP